MTFQDEYEHELSNLIYTPENIICDDVKIENELFTNGCDCISECKSNCKCIEKFGPNYEPEYRTDSSVPSENLKLVDQKFGLPVYECNTHCKCNGFQCGNRLVQFGPRVGLRIIRYPEKGYGLITTNDLPKGGFLCEYAGEVISNLEASKRADANEKHNLMNYIMKVTEHFGNTEYTVNIDPSVIGNIGRYLNHSCDPNCILVPVRIDESVPKIGIFAARDIRAESELTFNYGTGNLNTNNCKLKPCFCNSLNCKKWLPSEQD